MCRGATERVQPACMSTLETLAVVLAIYIAVFVTHRVT